MAGSAGDFPGLNTIKLTPLTGSDTTPRSYSVNTSFEPYRRDAFRHRTIPSQRESISLTNEPGEGTVNTEGLWRRGAFSWHHGAGQLYYDRGTESSADPFRFYESKGVDPWTEYQLGLLPDIQPQIAADDGHWVQGISVNQYVYWLDTTPNSLSDATSALTFYCEADGGYDAPQTPSFDVAPGGIWWLFTDGYNVYVSANNGLYVSTPGGGEFHQVISEGVSLNLCGTANGRIIMTKGPVVYDVTTAMGSFNGGSPGKLPTTPMSNLGTQGVPGVGTTSEVTGVPGAVYVHSNPQWVWTCICSGQSAIYMGGYAQNPVDLESCISAVYLFTEDSGTGALLPGSIALPLEQDEALSGLYFYLNFVFVGTNRGYRQCAIAGVNNPDSQSGDLIPGALFPNALQPFQPIFQPNSSPGQAGVGLVGYDRFVWFGWPVYDSVSGGIGRCDTSVLTGPNTPAYASDLMVGSADSPNTTLSVQRLFWCPITNGPAIVCGDASGGSAGLYTRKVDDSGFPVPVPSGTMNQGRITFGIPDQKLLAQANYKTASDATILPGSLEGYPVGGSVSLASNPDGAGWTTLTPLAPATQANPPVLLSPLTSGEDWEIQVTLNYGTEDDTYQWPFLTRYTVKALPQIVSGATISAVLMLYTDVDEGDQERFIDPYAEYAWLENLRLGQIPLTYTESGGLDGATQYTATVVIDEIDWLPFKKRDNPDGGFEGDLVLYLKTVVG